ncbi:MAG TPA: hypothetical protein VGE41_14075, partial [Verrucomicrobiae bacterium]
MDKSANKGRRRWRLGAVAVLGVVAVVWVFFELLGAEKEQTVALSDGTVFTLKKVSYGKEADYFCYGSSGERLLFTVTPKSWIDDVMTNGWNYAAISASGAVARPMLKQRIVLSAMRHTQVIYPGADGLELCFKSSKSNAPVNIALIAEELETGEWGPAALGLPGPTGMWQSRNAPRQDHYAFFPVFPRQKKYLVFKVMELNRVAGEI